MFSPIAIDGSEDMMTREELLVLQQGQNFLRTSGSANVNYMETLITLGKLAAQCTTGTGTASGGFKINWEKLMKVAMLDVGTAPEAADALYRTFTKEGMKTSDDQNSRRPPLPVKREFKPKHIEYT